MIQMRSLAALSLISFVGFAVACGSAAPRSGFDSKVEENPTQPSEEAGSSGGPGFNNNNGGADAGNGIGKTCAASVAETRKPKVDIIFVIDNSGSMNDEMNQVRTNVNTFVGKLGTLGLDAQVIFIVMKGTTANKICVPEPLAGPNCEDNDPIFHHINQDVQSSNSLKLILSTYDHTDPALSWAKYLRPDAFKAFVEVSDDGKVDLNADEFDTNLIAKGGGQFGTTTQRNYVFHAICGWTVGTTSPSNTKCTGADGPGYEYQRLAIMTGGIIESVCKTDYSSVLDNIGKGIVDRLACEISYPIDDTADPTMVAVQMKAADGTVKTLTKVTDASKCVDNPDSWYYDDPANPTKMILCTETCDAAFNTSATVEALVGCKVPDAK